jgi:hypothetical protein
MSVMMGLRAQMNQQMNQIEDNTNDMIKEGDIMACFVSDIDIWSADSTV